ncbi:MAG: hypothetical protein JW841_14475 [Deltaproteobacteria bacterium]|nr:hypothetical protein [Deltaproteobacteria bacterium]
MKWLKFGYVCLFSSVLALTSCGDDTKACVSSNCDFERCLKNNKHCQQNIDDHLDGCDWEETSGDCDSHGFPYQCRGNLYTYDASDCAVYL